MAWTTPKTWSVNELVTAANMNAQLRDNLLYLKGEQDFLRSRPFGSQYYTLSSAIQTTSTSYVDVDATNIKVTVSGTRPGWILVWAMFTAYKWTSGNGYFRLIYDGYYVPGTGDPALLKVLNTHLTIQLAQAFYAPTGGTHDFKLQFKTTSQALDVSPSLPVCLFALSLGV
jgi:hypothetical protein